MKHQNSDSEKDPILSYWYGRLLKACSESVIAVDQHSFDAAVVECFRGLREISVLKGISSSLFENPNANRKCAIGDATIDTFHAPTFESDYPAPVVLVTEDSTPDLLTVLKCELKTSVRANLISAFVSRQMINLLLDPFAEFIGEGGELRLLTSVMNDFNNPDDLVHLQSVVPGLQLRVYYPCEEDGYRVFDTPPNPFHVKCYLFEKKDGKHSVIIGSSNLTTAGLNGNCEWNYYSRLETNALFEGNQTAFQKGNDAFEKY